jgi:hypothetical protein
VVQKLQVTLLNPANGAVHALPEGLAEEHAKMDIRHYRTGIIFGLVASTGEYKVLRVLDCIFYRKRLCEVFTLDGSNYSRWRGKEAPPGRLEMQSGVAINGIVYLFSVEVPLDQDDDLPDQDAAPKRIASFDLETVEWRATLQGPQINLVGSLVVVHCHHPWTYGF